VRRQTSRGGHYERPETQEPVEAESTLRGARKRSASSRWNQSQEKPKPSGWRLRGQDKSAVCKNRITELHRTLDSTVNFGPGEEVPHLGSGAAHRPATSITGISGTAAVGGASIRSGT